MQTNLRTADPQFDFDPIGLSDDPDAEFDRVYDDFVQSITVSEAELGVLVAMPHASVEEVRRMFAVMPSRAENPRRARSHRRGQ